MKDHKQKELFDPWAFLSPKRRQLLEESWAGLYRNTILDELPVEAFAPYFKKDFGRPTKELYTVLSVLLLQQFLDNQDHPPLCFLNIHFRVGVDIQLVFHKYSKE